MNGVDTNILIYAIDRNEAVKRQKARLLIKQLSMPPVTTVLLWQVAGEFLRHLRFWENHGRLLPADTRRYFGVFRALFPLALPTDRVLDRALDFGDRYSLSHWDSMILGACVEAGVDTLYTEDMGAPATFGSVKLIDPFL